MKRIFDSRLHAACVLAEALADYRGCRPLVLAIARGAVGMGALIADELDGALDVILVRRLRAPFCPELAIGAIDEAGWTYVARYAPGFGADRAYLDREKAAQLALLRRQSMLYRAAQRPLYDAGRVAIVVDDGMVTGTTMITALLAARARRPLRLVCAVPAAPAETLLELAPCADDFVCPQVPEKFRTVSALYRDFPEVRDEEAAALLARRAASARV